MPTHNVVSHLMFCRKSEIIWEVLWVIFGERSVGVGSKGLSISFCIQDNPSGTDISFCGLLWTVFVFRQKTPNITWTFYFKKKKKALTVNCRRRAFTLFHPWFASSVRLWIALKKCAFIFAISQYQNKPKPTTLINIINKGIRKEAWH